MSHSKQVIALGVCGRPHLYTVVSYICIMNHLMNTASEYHTEPTTQVGCDDIEPNLSDPEDALQGTIPLEVRVTGV